MLLYHISCSDNHASIIVNGLVPSLFTGYEETPSQYIYLAFESPSKKIDKMKLPVSLQGNLLDDYLFQRSWELKCGQFNLYDVEVESLDQTLFESTNDPREVRYKGTIPPQNISLIQHYNASKIERHYRTLTQNYF